MTQSQSVIEIRFDPEKIRRGLYEEPQPKLSQGAAVILVQQNEFLVGLWEENHFVHPANQQTLAFQAEAAVRAAFSSESFASGTIRVFTCPAAIATKFDWNWPKHQPTSK